MPIPAYIVSITVVLMEVDVAPPEVLVAARVVLIVCVVAGALYFTPNVMLPFAAVAAAAEIAVCAAASVPYVVPPYT
jgi:hypothetical protein